jgi:hypothetical protein
MLYQSHNREHQMESATRLTSRISLVAIFFLAAIPGIAHSGFIGSDSTSPVIQASDNFDRPDSATVGNGWVFRAMAESPKYSIVNKAAQRNNANPAFTFTAIDNDVVAYPSPGTGIIVRFKIIDEVNSTLLFCFGRNRVTLLGCAYTIYILRDTGSVSIANIDFDTGVQSILATDTDLADDWIYKQVDVMLRLSLAPPAKIYLRVRYPMQGIGWFNALSANVTNDPLNHDWHAYAFIQAEGAQPRVSFFQHLHFGAGGMLGNGAMN